MKVQKKKSQKTLIFKNLNILINFWQIKFQKITELHVKINLLQN